jgi:hypothetical protein
VLFQATVVKCAPTALLEDTHTLRGDIQISVNSLFKAAGTAKTPAIFAKTRYGSDLKKFMPKDGVLAAAALVRWPISHIINQASGKAWKRAVEHNPPAVAIDDGDEQEMDT